MSAGNTSATQVPISQRCAVRGCKADCRPSQLMCIGHWRMVPAEVQRNCYSKKVRIRRAAFAEARRIVEDHVRQFEDRGPAPRAALAPRAYTPLIPHYCTNCGMSPDRCGCSDSDFASDNDEATEENDDVPSFA